MSPEQPDQVCHCPEGISPGHCVPPFKCPQPPAHRAAQPQPRTQLPLGEREEQPEEVSGHGRYQQRLWADTGLRPSHTQAWGLWTLLHWRTGGPKAHRQRSTAGRVAPRRPGCGRTARPRSTPPGPGTAVRSLQVGGRSELRASASRTPPGWAHCATLGTPGHCPHTLPSTPWTVHLDTAAHPLRDTHSGLQPCPPSGKVLPPCSPNPQHPPCR